ncbi:MAG: porin [Gammaproteobacteria bacterium]|nr:porin [Gammaproteobacteria bacterium]MCW8909460.1 porin [Gammaproteobacteria bacterium]MCW9005652.1 porin [Gammaproteobacteria bacterium]MCW9055027.1 porin [Gammaproteobacteria bacterium]
MKKIAICAAVAAICAGPITAMAGADIYGQLRYSFNSVDADGGAGDDGLVGYDNVSLFGLKASTEGDGIKAFIHLQTGAKADGGAGQAFDRRFYFGGLSGGFGKVAYGTMTNAYKFAGFAMDPFYNHSHVGVAGAVQNGLGTYGLSPLTNGFTPNALQYTSPAMGDVKINVGLYIDDSAADEHGTNIGAEYNKGGIKAGIQMASNGNVVTVPNLVADGDAMRIYGGYTTGNLSISASFESVDTGPSTDVDYMFLVGKYKISDKTRLAATLGTVGDGAAEGNGITAGVFQTVAPKTEVFVSTSMVSLDTTGAAEPSVISIGAIHKF